MMQSAGRWWRTNLSTAAKAASTARYVEYLKAILNARVYDVAAETALTPARVSRRRPTKSYRATQHCIPFLQALSARLGCQILIKREDMQPVFSFKV